MEQKNIVYLYPKTSCPCGEWCDKKYPVATGKQTNRGVRGCATPPYFDCNNRIEFSNTIEPNKTEGIYELNPQVYTQKQAPYFQQVRCENDGASCNNTWASWDPRLFSASHVQYLKLDRPPMDGSVKLKNIYSPALDCYGQNYNADKEYTDINDGQITYYIDRSREGAFYEPVFGTPALSNGVMFKDPMGSLKPEYTRIPTSYTENPTTQKVENYEYGLSFIQDTQSHREDIMSYQMRKINQQRWEPRWVKN